MLRKFALFMSMVPTSALAQAPVAPSTAERAAATDIAGKLMPDGTYQRLMGGTMSKMMAGLTDQMSAMPLAPFVRAAGLPESDTAKLGQTTIKQILDIVDPAYQQRLQTMMPVVMIEMGKVMTQFEPEMRKGLAEAYARHFSAAQLNDIDRFLNTSSGSAFASENMTIAADPAVMQKMQAFMPALMHALPSIMEKAQASTANLPKPKTPTELTEADRAKLAQLLGVSPEKLKTPPRS